MNINDNVSALCKLVSDLIGHRLSTLPDGNGGSVPAVLQNRTGNPKADFPYATVDHIGLVRVGYSQRDSYLDDNWDEVDEFDFIGRFFIQINGGVDNDALGICSEIASRMFTTKGKRKFNEYFGSLNSGLLKVSDPVFTSVRLATDFEESARITVDLWMRSIIVDETTDVIENVSVDGELYEDYDQVKPPLDVNITAP